MQADNHQDSKTVKCPLCGKVRCVGEYNPGKYFCRECFIEFNIVGDKAQIYSISLNGVPILIDEKKIK